MRTRFLNGWEQLICPYFASTCRRVIAPYLRMNGFAEKECYEAGGLIFSRLDVFVEVTYELDTAPNYAISMAIGLGEQKYDDRGLPCFVPYWLLLPADRPEHQGKLIRFRSEVELDQLLIHFEEQFLDPYAKPLWLDREQLVTVIAEFRRKISG